MISNANYETHKDEIELLKNILFEQLTILEESPNFKIEITINPDVSEDPKLNFTSKFTLPDDYPNCGPLFEINDISNYLATSKIKSFADNNIKVFIDDNLGMPMIYQIYEMIKEFANEQENLLIQETENERMIEEEKKRKYDEKINIDKNLLESRTFTPVTKEAFEVWFKKFYAETNKGKEKKAEIEARQSGREYFMNIKNLKDETTEDDGEDIDYKVQEEENTEEKPIYFDADAFEENIDDIDFEDEGYDDS